MLAAAQLKPSVEQRIAELLQGIECRQTVRRLAIRCDAYRPGASGARGRDLLVRAGDHHHARQVDLESLGQFLEQPGQGWPAAAAAFRPARAYEECLHPAALVTDEIEHGRMDAVGRLDV